MKKRAGMILLYLVLFSLLVSPLSTGAFSGKGTEANPFMLKSVKDLLALQKRVNAGDTCEGVHFKLGNNIILNQGMGLDLEWVPLKKFAGVLDGNGFSLCGLYVQSAYKGKFNPALGFGSGLIAELAEGGVVRNLTVSGRIDDPWYNEESQYAGGIAAINNGLIENCKASITFYRSYADFPAAIGGISGTNGWDGRVTGCTDESVYYEDPDINIVSGADAGFRGVTGYIFLEMEAPPGDNVDLARNMGRDVPKEWNQSCQNTSMPSDGVPDIPVDSADSSPQRAIFPMSQMRVTQGVGGSTSHTDNNYYAIDLGGADGEVDDVFAPFDAEVVWIDIKPGDTVTNSVFIQSREKVQFADGTLDYMVIRLAHDDDISDLKVGQKLEQGEVFYQEGTAGTKSNHVHLIVSKGAFDKPNRYKSAHFIHPEEAFVIDTRYTTVVEDKGYDWVNLGTP